MINVKSFWAPMRVQKNAHSWKWNSSVIIKLNGELFNGGFKIFVTWEPQPAALSSRGNEKLGISGRKRPSRSSPVPEGRAPRSERASFQTGPLPSPFLLNRTNYRIKSWQRRIAVKRRGKRLVLNWNFFFIFYKSTTIQVN